MFSEINEELNLQIESQETDTNKWYKKIFSGEIIKILEFSGTLNFKKIRSSTSEEKNEAIIILIYVRNIECQKTMEVCL